MGEILDKIMLSDAEMTAVVSGIALFAVWVPFYRGLRLCAQAVSATRRLKAAELEKAGRAASGRGVEPLALTLVRVIRKSLWEAEGESHPTEFIVDASKQYAMHEYESNFSAPISMYANILPPIGFIGTTVGLLILFLSMHASNSSLELGALALALTSSIFALTAFAVLEAAKIRLYGRLLASLNAALGAVRQARAEQAARGAARRRAPATV